MELTVDSSQHQLSPKRHKLPGAVAKGVVGGQWHLLECCLQEAASKVAMASGTKLQLAAVKDHSGGGEGSGWRKPSAVTHIAPDAPHL
jgi:hypothetical protein